MKIAGSVALVTGANRGLGLAFAQRLLAAGAAKVYAAARDPGRVTIPGVVPVRLDVTDPEQVAAAARDCSDVTLLINNAGIFEAGSLLTPDGMASFRRQMETNAVGPVALCAAFAPALIAAAARPDGGGAAIVNVLSLLSWWARGDTGAYSASKSASWAATNALRDELRPHGVQVVALHVGYMDTDMTRDVDAPKSQPDAVAAQVLTALEHGASEVLADEATRQVKAGLTAEPSFYLG